MKRFFILIGLLALMPIVAHATPDTMSIVQDSMKNASVVATAKIEKVAFKWLASFAALQFIVTQFSALLAGGEIQDAWKKLLKSLLWIGICIFFMENGVDFIDKVSNYILEMAGEISGAGQFSGGYIVDFGLNIAAGLINAVDKAKGTGFLASLNILPSIFTGITSLAILAAAALIGFKIFLIKVEVMLVLMLTPISLSFLGLDALKDQGIAPFKALVSLTYRILILAVIVSAMKSVGDSINTVLEGIDPNQTADIWKPIFASLFGYFLLAYLAYSSDRIAANLASGGTSMGVSDAAVAAGIGAAVGGTLGRLIGGAGQAAASAAKPMSEVMQKIQEAAGGGSGSISNAGARGNGNFDPQPVGTPPPSMSKGPGLSPGLSVDKHGSPFDPTTPYVAKPHPDQGGKKGGASPSQPSEIPSPGPSGGDVDGGGSGKSGGIAGNAGGADGGAENSKSSGNSGAPEKPNHAAGLAQNLRDLHNKLSDQNPIVHVSMNTNSKD